MIQKIDIEKFGVFTNYKWYDSFKEKPYFFGRRNIIYGRNYSGKTTLSRIFRSLELGELHKDYSDGKFTITLKNGKKICEKDVGDIPLKIRVYNSDFVKDNIKFESGEMKPFAVIGEKNIEIEGKIKLENARIKEYQIKLEDKENGIKKQYDDTFMQLKELENHLTKSLSEKASEIKNNPILFMVGEKRRYDIRDLKKEIPNATPIDKNIEWELVTTLKEDIKELIPLVELKDIDLNYLDFAQKANELLSKTVKPSKIIRQLANNHELQEWVREGIKHHKGKLHRCAFCGQRIREERWEELDRHFTDVVEKYTNSLDNLLKELEEKIYYVKEYNLPISEDSLYSLFVKEYNAILADLNELKEISLSKLKEIYKTVKIRRQNLFTTSKLIEIDDGIELKISKLVEKINKVIIENNNYTKKYKDEANQAREKLRLNEIHRFLQQINYDKIKSKIEKYNNELEALEKEKNELEEKIQESMNKINELEKSLKDEKNSIILINSYLNNFLGHPELYLDFEEDESTGKVTKFVVKRNGVEAKNLSEGEQSLLAFCYFLAQLKNIEDVEEYMVYIDDPISSLDTNHVFYIYSLIDSEIARKHFKQLFISTHNLDFLGYLCRLSKPKKDSRHGNEKENYENKYYFIEKKLNKNFIFKSLLIKMPKYIQNNITEFIYLFHQIYRVATETQTDDNFEIFYTYPNTARKFLETYMFFKYPDVRKSTQNKLLEFFDGKREAVSFLNRINNEYSHGMKYPERLFKPIDIPEFQKNANYILDTILSNDPVQYESFLNSIGKKPHTKLYEIDRDEYITV